MTPLTFLRQPEVRELLERASTAAATPVAIHYLLGGDEGPCIVSVGQCAVCRHVHDLPGGSMACRGSRVKASLEALRDGIATPFLCHMGFACVAAPVFPGTSQGFIITFGPYGPAEAPDALLEDARRGLVAFGEEDPDGLDDLLRSIRLVHSDVVPAIVDWTVRDLNALWEAQQKAAFSEEETPEPPPPTRRARASGVPENDLLHAAAIAAGLAGGNQREVRSTILTVLSESSAGTRAALAARRARALALTGAVIEAAERARFDVRDCWERLPEFIGMVCSARTNAELATAVTGVLRVIRHNVKTAATDASIEALNKALQLRLDGAVTLNEIAAELGVPPSTITRRLQRKFGMSFSEYAAKQRVNRAKRLLRTTTLGIGEVALRVGINDPGNFSKMFRKCEGCTPQKYRERFGKKP
ncbi:MAG TPA: helix-turn-helix domain-containing protein [Candidatus Hydrogenedentes bacterium]|jgi:AraC-like DNA-binding protein|nr:helix-turn-helix domain-containing protein [Candidatus Hydrogenedentota bacterium]HPJ98872.1 helix-turn-helix domain-containing protein [Candidatus Hydrogenedentota bacterium]